MSFARTVILALLVSACAGLLPSAARADFIFTFPPADYSPVLSAANLGNFSGPYAIEFALTNGGNATNMVTIDSFDFGGGTPTGSPTYAPVGSSGASGDLSSSVTITENNNFTNFFFQGFTPGSQISFRVDAATIGGGDPTVNDPPDEFQFFVLGDYDGAMGGTPVPTDDPSGANSLATLIIDDPTNPTLTFYHLLIPEQGGGTVPEPTSLALLGMGLVAALRYIRRQRRCVR